MDNAENMLIEIIFDDNMICIAYCTTLFLSTEKSIVLRLHFERQIWTTNNLVN